MRQQRRPTRGNTRPIAPFAVSEPADRQDAKWLWRNDTDSHGQTRTGARERESGPSAIVRVRPCGSFTTRKRNSEGGDVQDWAGKCLGPSSVHSGPPRRTAVRHSPVNCSTIPCYPRRDGETAECKGLWFSTGSNHNMLHFACGGKHPGEIQAVVAGNKTRPQHVAFRRWGKMPQGRPATSGQRAL